MVRTKSWNYETSLRWNQEQEGELASTGLPGLGFGSPPEFGGKEGRWGPETLLLGATESCTLLTFLALAKRKSVKISAYRSTAAGTLAADAEGVIRFTEITLRPVVQVNSEAEAEAVRAIFQDVPKRCFISCSLKTEPRIELTVEVSSPSA
ncbi:OsmC family protein [Hyalangium versicolor]|uniref:OsmC family protein n=1 Tax=Hyalangium versicolor TaxID=2861190 RepID=UPI001CC99B00|nr:OsmC family protein [Hyalangium versicolor]